ncbi:hypothetical protein HY251_12925 [bacterium]|nr:hypothetical protein [bacterium]
MEDERLLPGDRVTVRKGAPLPPDGHRRLTRDCCAKVVEVAGRRVKVAVTAPYIDNDDGSRILAPFVTFDLSYVYRVDSL